MGFFTPTIKHPDLVNGATRLGRVLYWLGCAAAGIVVVFAGSWVIEAAMHDQFGGAWGAAFTGCLIALVPFSIGRGLRYVLAGE